MRMPPPGKKLRLLRSRKERSEVAKDSTALRAPEGAELQALRDVLARLSDPKGGAATADGLRLLSKGETLDEAAARDALAPVPLEVWEEAGLLLRDDGEVLPQVRMVRHAGLTMACDADWYAGGSPRSDTVMGITTSTLWLASFTPRRRAGRALDLGTGSGLQALLAARHCDHVTAIDLNPRALEFARFNATLNGVSNVDFAMGDLLDVKAEEPYDLVVCNPPFVISPRDDCLYRDSGLDGDEFVRRVVEAMPGLLAEGGFGQLVCDWIEPANRSWAERLAGWTRGSGCDAWVLRGQGKDPAAYAGSYLSKLPEPERSKALEEWTAFYERCQVERIGFGVITLRRAGDRANWFRAESLPGRVGQPAGGDVERGFAATDFLRAQPGAALLDRSLRASPSLRIEPQVEARDGRWCASSAKLTLSRGLSHSVNVDPVVLGAVLRCDGSRTLRQLLDAAAESRKESVEVVAPRFLKVIHQLVARGFLCPSASRTQSTAQAGRVESLEESGNEPKIATG